MGKNNFMFRLWYYFRQGWSIYFAFIFAAINTLTVTYFLAIDNYPSLKSVFPSFELYIIILSSIGIPILIFIGYAHYKKTQGFKSEIDIIIESNPYQRRILVNTETALSLQLKLVIIIQTMAKNQEIDQNHLDEIKKLTDEISAFMNKRTFNSDDDLEYFKKKIRTKTFPPSILIFEINPPQPNTSSSLCGAITSKRSFLKSCNTY